MLEQKGIYAVLKNNLSLLEGLEFTPPVLEQKGIYAVLKNNLSLLEGLEFTPPSSARTKGDTRYIRNWYVYMHTWYKYVYQHFLFDFPFDEIYVRLLFFTLGRSFYA